MYCIYNSMVVLSSVKTPVFVPLLLSTGPGHPHLSSIVPKDATSCTGLCTKIYI